MKQIILFLFVCSLAGCFGASPKKTGKEGKHLPEFSLLLTDSTTWLNSKSMPSGRPIALFYYSPYCGFCKSQIQEITEEMEDLKNIQFYFISSFPISTIKEFANAYQLAKYPNIVTGIDTANFAHSYFEAEGVPYLAIYGKDKKLIHSFLGKISSNQIKEVSEE